MEPLSSTDAAFLHLETPETPMHVGSLMLLELPAGYQGDFHADVQAQIGRRLHLARVFHRKLARMPFDLADPVWVDEDEVDLEYHVRSVTLRKPGTMAQLEALVARLHSSLLDRSRPLWEVYVIDGLASGEVGYYSKAHHAAIDGKAGAEIAKVFYDLAQQPREVAPPAPRERGRAPTGAELLQAAASHAGARVLQLGTLMPAAAKALGQAAWQFASDRPKTPERRLGLKTAPKTVFNTPVSSQRSFAALSVPMAEVKALGRHLGGTLNDTVMAMCSGGLRTFLEARGQLPRKSLLALVPVSLRDADDACNNNQVSAIRVDLASDIADPLERFRAIRSSSEKSKAVIGKLKPVLGVDLPIIAAPWLVTGAAALFVRSNLTTHLPAIANVAISNVPGPAVPLYIAGARVRHFHPVSIATHGYALNITVQSYAGQVDFGITACARVLSQADARELAQHLLAALRELQRLVPAPVAALPAPAPIHVAPIRTRPRQAATKRPAVAAARFQGSQRRSAAAVN